MFLEKADELLWNSRFGEVNDILKALDPDNLSTPLILGVLCITKPALNELPHRAEFFEMAWDTVKKRGKDPVKILEFFRNIPKENEPRS